MRRDSWRSVPMMCRPPAALTCSCSDCHSSLSWRCARPSRHRQAGVGLDEAGLLLDVAAQHDVGAAAGHVGGDGDHLRTAGLRHDLGFARVLLGVEHLVRQLFLVQQVRQIRSLDRGRAHQHRLAALVAVADVASRRRTSFVVL
jgi:hypothetical protein